MGNNKNENHLPIYGPGPVYVGVIVALTAAAVLFRNASIFADGKVTFARVPFVVAGSFSILSGIALWIYAVPVSKIDDGILENRLVTTGAYAWVRNPIYSAF
ncbi:MAG: isoprenylcysteine carboxylmethyltransferase family protein, partial [Oscillospiraceae bacterium]|nr:isoprenylcysteine carboxylmethyltransferase family protein [Oscillospiraceae bacterium]